MARTVGIGIQSFEKIREKNRFLVEGELLSGSLLWEKGPHWVN